MVVWWLWVAAWVAATTAVPLPHEVDSEQTRKLLGESVVTSVSVIMDHGNGTKTYITDDKKEDKKPQVVGTPGTLLSPDRYEFYTFGEDGELVKKLMSLDQIQSLIAGGTESDELEPLPVYYPQPLVDSSTHNEGVSKVLETVQNLLKGELQAAKVQQRVPPMPMPDHSWSILLPGLINSDIDYKEPTVPLRKEPTPLPSISNDISSTRLPSTPESHKRPIISSTTTKYTTPSRPNSPSTMLQKISTSSSTTQLPQPTSAKKPSTDPKYPTNHITPPPNSKTTGHLVTKIGTQRPISTTKRPAFSTKKPYVSDSPYSKIPLISTTRPETTSRPATTPKKPPVTPEERISSTMSPESKKPIPEKQKPSGIPSITHYLPISSSSSSPSNASSNVTTPGQHETAATKQKITTTKEPLRTTTKPPVTKLPSSQGVNQKLTHTTTKKPTKPSQGKPGSIQHKNPSNTHKPSPSKVTQKPRPTPSPVHNTTKAHNKLSSTARPMAPTTTKDKPTPKPTTESTFTTYQLINTSTKQTLPPNTQKPVNTKKPEIPKPISNLVGQSSNTVNSKVKPPTVSQLTTVTRPTTTPKPTTTSTTTTTHAPEKITTFSYTSKLTSTGEVVTSTVPTITTQRRVTTASALSTTSSTKINGVTTMKVTEKPLTTTEKTTLKVTQSQLQSASVLQATKGQPSTPLLHKPTTYHPQNFHTSSKRPVLPTTQESTSSFPESMGISFEALKISTTNAPNTAKPTMPSSLKSPSQSTETQRLTTNQATTKPTTEVSPEGTTIGTTTLSITETTQNGINIFSTDDMPLQEIPLKIYESLKDNIGAQDIMTTIMSENLLTTTGKMESSYTTTNLEDTTLSSTLPAAERATVTASVPNGSSTEISDKTEATNRLSSQKIDSTTNVIPTTLKNEVSEKDALQGSASMPEEQRTNITKSNNFSALLENSTPPTVEYSNSTDSSNSETTTNMDSTTIYKDQILQDGISAVTNILLDEDQRQQAINEAMLASAINKYESKENLRTTTENELTSTTVADYTEMHTRHSSDKDEMKSEVRLNEDTELPENVTTEKIETTTVQEKSQTTTAEEKPKNTTSHDKQKTTTDKPKTTSKPFMTESTTTNFSKSPIKKGEKKPAPVLPTKESKLNPDIDPNIEILKIKPGHTESLKFRTTTVPQATPSTEKVKLAEFQEKSVPKPPSTFSKKPNPVYQPLESLQPPAAIELHPAPYESMGLEASIAFLSEDVRRFADLCNELAFRMWTSITGKGQISSRSLVMSPFAVTSLLAMVFLGAREPTSGQMNDVLRLDDMVTFNPHQVLQNVTESVINSKNYGVATAAFVRELYSDKGKGKILDFYKERVQQYYQGHVEEVTFSMIGDIIRRRTNLLVKRQTLGKVPEYLRGSSLSMRPPLAAFSANIFQTDCEQGSTDGRDGEMYFVVRPSTRQRRLVPVPAVVWRSGFLAGYEPSLDATSVSLGADSIVSTILILPGQQGQVAPGDGLARLEQRLIETSYRRGGWSRLLRSLMPRPGLELQIPRFSHRSVLNVTGALQRMGLRDLFNNKADLRGLNGLSNDLHLSDMLQVNTFSTCGEETIGARHHVETYPASPQRMGRDGSDIYRDFDAGFGDVTLSLRPRQTRLPDNPRLRFDRPFLYMVRHNPSGMILHMGRFNPRLLP